MTQMQNLAQIPENEVQLSMNHLPQTQLQQTQLPQNQFGIIQPDILTNQNLPMHSNTSQIHLTPPIHQLVPPMMDGHFLGIDAVQAAAVIAQRNAQLSWGAAAGGVNA